MDKEASTKWKDPRKDPGYKWKGLKTLLVRTDDHGECKSHERERKNIKKIQNPKRVSWNALYSAGADPGFFLGEGALVSSSSSTP